MKLRVGLTGGIGSGKTEVGRIFADAGALVIDADASAREALAPGTPGLAVVSARWPEAAAAGGALDRVALARIVFADPRARAALEAIVHPIVRALGREREAGAGDRIVVHEVPLLFEAGFWKECDANVLVVAARERRVARAVARSGLAPAEIERRMEAQIDPARARALADIVIDNDGSLDDLRKAANAAYRRLAAWPRRRSETSKIAAE
ncbi:MAG: dephospho-CoA kinase [Candidatus Baltobacteraceae bacterium]